jgi:hypothetical protein
MPVKCYACHGPVIGYGFFQRVLHRKDCDNWRTARYIMGQMGIPDQIKRCERCRENMTPADSMCDDCAREWASGNSIAK